MWLWTVNSIVPYVWSALAISVPLCSRQEDWNLGVLQELFSNTLQQKLFYTITSRGGHNNQASTVLEAHANLRQFFESMARDHRRLHCQPLHTQLLCHVLKVLASSALPGRRHHSKQEHARAHFRRNALCFFQGLLSHRRPIQRYEYSIV